MFASLISEKQCAVVLICDYLVASEVERFLIFLFISFVSSFMHWHFVFFSTLFLISPTSLLFSTPHWQDFGSASNYFQGYFSPWNLSSFTLDRGGWGVIFVLSHRSKRKLTLKQKAPDKTFSSASPRVCSSKTEAGLLTLGRKSYKEWSSLRDVCSRRHHSGSSLEINSDTPGGTWSLKGKRIILIPPKAGVRSKHHFCTIDFSWASVAQLVAVKHYASPWIRISLLS